MPLVILPIFKKISDRWLHWRRGVLSASCLLRCRSGTNKDRLLAQFDKLEVDMLQRFLSWHSYLGTFDIKWFVGERDRWLHRRRGVLSASCPLRCRSGTNKDRLLAPFDKLMGDCARARRCGLCLCQSCGNYCLPRNFKGTVHGP
ncbi:hypothetical protein FOCC_FOCC015216 [Frankliniella occidentalis]|nr:hypothetical protein FOCC_FOCC015216 [Frankliniella occidentalis]